MIYAVGSATSFAIWLREREDPMCDSERVSTIEQAQALLPTPDDGIVLLHGGDSDVYAELRQRQLRTRR